MDLAKCWVDTGLTLGPGCRIVLPLRGRLTGHVALKVLRAEIQWLGVQLLYEGNGTALRGTRDEDEENTMKRNEEKIRLDLNIHNLHMTSYKLNFAIIYSPSCCCKICMTSVEHKRRHFKQCSITKSLPIDFYCIVCPYNGSQWEPKLFSSQHYSKYLLLCSTEESHSGLEQHENKVRQIFHGWIIPLKIPLLMSLR